MTENLTNQTEKPSEIEKIAEYTGGKVDYSVISEINAHNPVVLVPGFTISRLVQRDFANTLHEKGDRQVIFSEQPNFSWKPSMQPVVDRHAEALLAIIKAEDLGGRPVDFITHSFGSIIFTRAAELAKERALKSFDSDEGSRAIFISPAGTNDAENLFALGSRFVKFMTNGAPLGKELDPDGKWMREGLKNFVKRPLKTAKEVAVLQKKEVIYKKLGSLGIRPALLGYGSDDLMPFEASESVIMNEEFTGGGYSVPIDFESKVVKGATSDISLKKFRDLTGLSKEKAAKEWARHTLGAGHNDLLFNPERTVRAVLPILGGDMLERSKSANQEYLGRHTAAAQKKHRIVL